MFTTIVKGDTINFEGKIDADITGWKIRAEICDGCNSIKLATVNSGGSDDQIDITSVSDCKSTFLIQVQAGLTKCFDEKATIEIEVETDAGEIFTPFCEKIKFKDQKIDWETP